MELSQNQLVERKDSMNEDQKKILEQKWDAYCPECHTLVKIRIKETIKCPSCGAFLYHDPAGRRYGMIKYP